MRLPFTMTDLSPNFVNLNTFESCYNAEGKKIKRLDHYYAKRQYIFKHDIYEKETYINRHKTTQKALKNMSLHEFANEYKVKQLGGVRLQTVDEKSKLYPHIQPNLDFYKDSSNEKYWLFCKNSCIKYIPWIGCPTKIIVNEDLDFDDRFKLYFSQEVEVQKSKKKEVQERIQKNFKFSLHFDAEMGGSGR